MEKFWLQKLQSNKDSDHLVPKFSAPWVKKFLIRSDIVKMQKPDVFLLEMKQTEFNQQFILKAVLMFSCCVFSIAAENRSISKKILIQKNQERKQISKSSLNKDKIDSYIQTTRLIQIENFVLSKIIHNKAVEILIYGFPQDIQLLTHFKEIFKKHYSNINTIPEVNEPSIESENNYDSNEDDEAEKSFKNEIQNLKNKIKRKMMEKKHENLSQNQFSRYKDELSKLIDSQDNTLANKSSIVNTKPKRGSQKRVNTSQHENSSYKTL